MRFQVALIFSAFVAATVKCDGFEFGEKYKKLLSEFKQKYDALLNENNSESSMPCVVMKMDNPGVPDDFKSWHNYDAVLEICTCDKRNFLENGTHYVSCNPVEENGRSYYLSVPVSVSNRFIKKEQERGEKFGKITEYGCVPDWHSPWFVLSEKQARFIFSLLDEYQSQ